MSLIGKHARISENLGCSHALHVDRHFLVEFDMTDILSSFGILWTFINVISVMRLRNNVVSLVYLLFPHELVSSLLIIR